MFEIVKGVWSRRSEQVVDVCQILKAAYRALVRDELVPAEEEHRLRSVVASHLTVPGLIKGDAFNRCEQVHSIGRHTELDDFAWRRKVFDRERETAKTKVCERGQELRRVGG